MSNEEDYHKDIINRLEKIRVAKKLKKKDMAKLLNISPASYADMLKKKKKIQLFELKVLIDK